VAGVFYIHQVTGAVRAARRSGAAA
jgi:hypothetical protein